MVPKQIKANSCFIADLIKARRDMGSIKKNSKGYNYKYTNLEDLIKHIEEPLFSNGFIILQELISKEDGCDYLRTTLAHTSGEERASEIRIPSTGAQNSKMSELQSLGSAITYLKRYSILALLFLATEDDDGATASQMTRSYKQPKKINKYITTLQSQEMQFELRDYPDLISQVKSSLNIDTFSQMKLEDFKETIAAIKRVKKNREQVG